MHDGTGAVNGRKMSGWQIAHAITNHIQGLGSNEWDDVTVEYDEKNQGFKFHQTKATPDVITIGATTAALRSLLGNVATNAANNTKDGTTLTNMTVSGSQQLLENVRGNGEALVASSRRSGLLVEYAGGKFTFKSGKTGDSSSIEIRATETTGKCSPG